MVTPYYELYFPLSAFLIQIHSCNWVNIEFCVLFLHHFRLFYILHFIHASTIWVATQDSIEFMYYYLLSLCSLQHKPLPWASLLCSFPLLGNHFLRGTSSLAIQGENGKSSLSISVDGIRWLASINCTWDSSGTSWVEVFFTDGLGTGVWKACWLVLPLLLCVILALKYEWHGARMRLSLGELHVFSVPFQKKKGGTHSCLQHFLPKQLKKITEFLWLLKLRVHHNRCIWQAAYLQSLISTSTAPLTCRGYTYPWNSSCQNSAVSMHILS